MKLAAIAYEAGEGEIADAILREAAQFLRSRGLKLAGTVQWNAATEGRGRCAMELEDLASGRRYSTAVDGPLAPQSCKLDASALEDVAGHVAGSLEPNVDFVIINRFGKQETAGAGFRPIIEAAVANDLPVLTAHNRAYGNDWAAFAGGASSELPPALDAVVAWCEAVLSSASASADPAQPQNVQA